ncbi:uncharacterized protein STEHIDRAFT_124876 [Stereum hirsutum FP-91666 SS1]|uniref:uncharacterized protein n=1 Tax=Stereum hirsutum (strain FP-91666) TaxID=721885 RepID=UPI00044493DE|nr:uncharacterized protein STEHIDRAFT_124876 [Stereum hirsutum FP-91666 SS1]EIM82065.1 hypothetical protein STEHIDRAFT_124876 [Stereum hirsutum FP-91666 SS1]
MVLEPWKNTYQDELAFDREYEGRGTLALRPHLTILDSPDDDRLFVQRDHLMYVVVVRTSLYACEDVPTRLSDLLGT